MKRDMDLIRTVLLRVEERPQFAGAAQEMGHLAASQAVSASGLGIADHGDDEVRYHAGLLIDGAFLEGKRFGNTIVLVYQLTWRGLDSVRDPKIWHAAKKGVNKAGGFSLEMLGALAKGLIKKKIEEHTGVKLDL